MARASAEGVGGVSGVMFVFSRLTGSSWLSVMSASSKNSWLYFKFLSPRCLEAISSAPSPRYWCRASNVTLKTLEIKKSTQMKLEETLYCNGTHPLKSDHNNLNNPEIGVRILLESNLEHSFSTRRFKT